MNFGTHCYIGSLPCGCGAAFVRDMPEYAKDTAKEVADMIKRGLTVQRLNHEAGQVAFDARCERYPHEDWQRRIEAARSARESAPAVDAVAKG